MKAHAFLVALLYLLTFNLSAQLSVDRPIMSVKINAEISDANLVVPKPNMAFVKAQDAAEDTIKDIPYRFGIPYEFDRNVINDATISQVSGGRVYRYLINAPGATSINLIYGKFSMPEGCWMHVYNRNRSQVLGAFTRENELENRQFATSFIFDDHCIIEIFVPTASKLPEVELSHVIYGYRSLKSGTSFGSSKPCNNNVICPEARNFQEEKRSVVMIALSLNNRICTGALVNNVREDKTPYVLSAYHCTILPTSLYIFNYESSRCFPSLDSTISHTITGGKMRARNAGSDFALIELSSMPPPEFNSYYSGWDNTGETPLSGTCIHHPMGDQKKISFDYKPLVSEGYPGKGSSHWQVTYWDDGTTEPASSGSPLYNEDERIVGQLQGGLASCNDPMESDYFGKFFLSWDLEPDSNRQLKFWLDPDNTGATVLNGYDPSGTPDDYDVALLGFPSAKGEVCGSDSIYPTVVLKNRGNNQISDVVVSFFVNNIFDHKKNFNVNLNSGQSTTLAGKGISYSSGVFTLSAEVEVVGHTETNTADNHAEAEYNGVQAPIPVELHLITDDYEAEVSWQLLSSTGTELYAEWNYINVPGNIDVRDTFCLYDGCFTFNIFDDSGDGICCKYGNGSYMLTNLITGDTIVFADEFKGSDSTHFFCLGDSCTISARGYITNASSSSATDGKIRLEMLSGIPPFAYQWSNGMSSRDITGLSTGIYSVTITDSMGCSNTLEFRVSIGTGITETTNALLALRFYPNPTTGLLTLDGIPEETIELSVFSTTGEKVMQKTIDNRDKQIRLDLSGMNKGLYLIAIKSGNEVRTERIILQ